MGNFLEDTIIPEELQPVILRESSGFKLKAQILAADTETSEKYPLPEVHTHTQKETTAVTFQASLERQTQNHPLLTSADTDGDWNESDKTSFPTWLLPYRYVLTHCQKSWQ